MAVGFQDGAMLADGALLILHRPFRSGRAQGGHLEPCQKGNLSSTFFSRLYGPQMTARIALGNALFAPKSRAVASLFL